MTEDKAPWTAAGASPDVRITPADRTIAALRAVTDLLALIKTGIGDAPRSNRGRRLDRHLRALQDQVATVETIVATWIKEDTP